MLDKTIHTEIPYTVDVVIPRPSLWERVSYKHKYAEFILYFLTVSGVMLWDGFGFSWQFTKSTLLIHFLASFFLVPLFIVPFWLAHRESLKMHPKPFLRKTGRIIEVILIIMMVSGFYLALFGNRGDVLGQIAYWAHLLPSIPMALFVYFHAKRWSMLKITAWVIPFFFAIVALSLPAFAATESSSLHLSQDGKTLYSANFDTGTVSLIERESGKRLAEIQVGGELRRIALDEKKNLLAVTDYTGGRVVFIDLATNRVEKEVVVGHRPFGIVYDPKNNIFWTALFEDHRLIGLNKKKGIIHNIKVEETPRGLALLNDGRLLITHAMVGKVSLWDTRQKKPILLKTIVLHETQDPDEFVSQGVPRILDDIAVSPDENEAWLPHVLWNFDHPFQFQSTIFPSVSLLALDKGQERELIDRRKHLFKQINIIDTGNRTRIVSNPHDAAFSEDGKKVYVTLAGSEDLMVFDLLRRTEITKKKKKRSNRRKGKLNQGGAKAMQIFRHIPGSNPRGLVVSRQDIFVQNAMSLDLVKLNRGGEGPFSRVKLAKSEFSQLVEKDPIPAALRRGKTTFNSGNTDKSKQFPIAGDFWMSCQSCHVDGFNFTNGYLYNSTPTDIYKNAVIGHKDLSKMVAGDFVGDYLRIIQGTQGGMGHDPRDGADKPNLDKPPKNIIAQMEDLHTFVNSKGNLPLTSTWLRLDDERKVIHEKEWVNSAACAECHSDMFDQWADSLHRLMGDSNPYYKVVEEVAAQTEGEEFRKWCMGCHHPQGLLSGLTATIEKGHMFEKGGKTLFEALEKNEPDLDEGTGCLFCHRITKLESASSSKGGANASFTVNVKDREQYFFENNSNPILNWVGNQQINAKPEVHTKSYLQPFYKDSELCSTCHNEFAPGSGSLIVDTYGEWEKSDYNNPSDPSKHRSCIDCHMHGDIKKIGQNIPGISTDGGRVKENVVTHQFTGANHHLVGLRNEKLAKMSIELLQSAAELSGRMEKDGQLAIRVRNIGAGHALPTGVADFRQLWLDITVKDSTSKVVLEHGKMDDKGIVPEDARMFQKVFGDKNGKPVGLLFWRYEKMLKDTKIPANGHRDELFDLPSELNYPLQVDVKLMFRIYPQWVTDAVRKTYPELPNPQAVIMTQLNTSLERP
ncbi:MAG: hypothetical protein OQJ97_12995 [Rhodospirillales bacterium]|nr:hypothetical protein [Rhodospirillales bacterium]